MNTINFPATRFAVTKTALESLIETGIKDRFGTLDAKHTAFLENEKRLLYMAPESWYKAFIIVHNEIRNIKGVHPGCVTAGRGTLACSLIAYLLNLTDIDPVVFGLSCERLYAVSNIKPIPDFDFEVATSAVPDMYKNLRLMYGEDYVFGCTVSDKKGRKGKHACAVFISDKPYSEYGDLFVDRHNSDLKILDRDRIECEGFGLFRINIIKSHTAELLMRLTERTGTRMTARNLEYLSDFLDNDSDIANPICGRIDLNFYNNSFDDFVFAAGQLYARNTTMVTMRDKMSWHKTGIAKVDEILKNTYGRILFQEQINEILAYALDTNLVNANTVRVDIQRKKTENVNSYFCRFVETLTGYGLDHMTVCNLWITINKHTDLTLKSHIIAMLYTVAEIEYLKSLC